MKKYTSGAFESTTYGIYKSAQDTITSFPAEIIADGENASGIIYGNMQQSGTPTPSSPIYPSECGDKTANLCNESTLQNGYFGTASTFPYTADDNYRCFSMELSAGTYTIFAKSNDVIIRLLRVSSTSLGANAVYIDNQAYTFTLSATETIYVSMKNSTTTNNFTGLTIMLNEGNTALPYDKFGYKIPILSGGTTTNVYMGEVQSTRQIKKLVLTGEEIITQRSTPAHTFSMNYSTNHYDGGVLRQGICSHFKGVQSADSMTNGDCYFGTTALSMRYDAADNETDFKSYLQQQYSAGTPVCVWYVLETPTTSILNEPIRKIDTYSDIVAAAAIPTTAGSQTFNVDTTLKPSSVELTYTGWHRYDDKKSPWTTAKTRRKKKSV